MILCIEYFDHTDPNRRKEYIQCLKHNLNCNSIERIEIFISDENCTIPLEHDKININRVNSRPTYDHFFNFCNNNHFGKICIISNSDIQFDGTLTVINDDNISGKFVALSRWDILQDGSIKLFDRPDSQDCWIFKSPISFKRKANFLLGKPGCDNRIAYMAHESGLTVTNPSKQIITKHLHLTGIRSYTPKETVCGMHMRVSPNGDINKKSDTKSFNFQI